MAVHDDEPPVVADAAAPEAGEIKGAALVDKVAVAEAAAGANANTLLYGGAPLAVAMFCLLWPQFQVHVFS